LKLADAEYERSNVGGNRRAALTYANEKACIGASG